MKQGWKVEKIGDVCQVIAGQSPEGTYYNDKGKGLPFYQGKKEFTEKYIGEPTTWTTKVTKEAQAGDILMSVRAPVGPVNFATQKICIGRGLAAIRASKAIDKEFLFYFLLKHEEEIVGNAGAVFSSINKTQIENIELPLPPLPEQQRIVALLDETFAALTKVHANAERNQVNAREVFESALDETFNQQNKNLPAQPLADLCEDSRLITYGVVKLGDHIQDGVPCLRTSNVRWLRIETDNMKRISPSLSKQYSRTILKGGEVLVNVRGTLGGVAVVPDEMAGWNMSREVAIVPVDKNKIDPYFVSYLIASGISQKWFGGVTKGAAYVGINIEDLRLLPIIVPPLAEQRVIVQRLDALAVETRRLEEVYQQKVEDVEELRKSVLQKAFEGEI